MRNLLAFVGGAMVTFLGMGWYLDWYKLSREPGTTPGSSRLQIDINNEKIRADVSRGVQRGKEILENALEKKPASTEPAKPGDDTTTAPQTSATPVKSTQTAPTGALINVTLPALPAFPTAEPKQPRGN